MKKLIIALLVGLSLIQQVAYSQCKKGNLIFQDEFNGTSLDLSKWNYDLGNGCPSLCGWGNNEKEYYTNSTQNVNVSDGYLNLTALYSPNYMGSGSDFTSGKIQTKGKFDRLYGRFEAKIKMPAGSGLWPAFWMLPTDNYYGSWPTSGEIDIMEYRGDQEATIHSTLHYGNVWPGDLWDGTSYNLPSGNFTDAFHEFAVEWQPGILKFYVDNVLIKTETQNPNSLNPASNNPVSWPWDKRYYIILNLALGGGFSGNPSTQDILNSTTFPQSLQVDYVRVYDMAPLTTQAPFAGTAIAIPGKIEAENYNIGCEGVAYHDTDSINQGNVYRSDGVDIEVCTDAGGGYDVGWTAPGEWLNYDVNITSSGYYTISARMASLPGGKNFHLELDSINITGPMTVPATGAWSTFQTITVTNVHLTSGSKVLKIVFDDGGVNCNWVQFDLLTNTPPQVSISSPANHTTYSAPANVTINANATDDGSISKVEFFQGSVKLGEDSSSPYSFDWNNIVAGTYSITAKAIDNSGLTTTSAAITITVNATTLTALPLDFINTSSYTDNQIYVAIVGQDLAGAYVWVDLKTGNQIPMDPTYNTVAGPVYNGNKGPGGNGMYADCFTKLSDISNKTVDLHKIQGCRIFVSFKQQLYFYFFGSTGAVEGYTSPSITDPTDPNTGIKYEIIELTYNQYGFWGNTTRVDGYSYPMGLELTGGDGFQKTGEIKSYQEIAPLYLESVPVEFKNCYDSTTGTITFPTKTPEFADGSVGTMPTPGPYVDYMKPYIDAIWAKYANEDLLFDAGDAGIWKGRVLNEQLVMTAQSGGYSGRKGIVTRRPTTQEAFEGKGVLNNVVQDATTDLIVQAQLCAAITRHVVNTTTPNVGLQNWSDPATYYQASPCNYYAKFWHQLGISYNQKSYAFAYDDVFNQSSTLHSPTPAHVTVVIGGFGNQPPTISITSPANDTAYVEGADITITAIATDSNGSIAKVAFFNGISLLGTAGTGPDYTYTWKGVAPGSYTIRAVATDSNGVISEDSVVISVDVLTGINGVQTNQLSYYPNPTKNVLYFGTEIDYVTVYSVNGILVKSISLGGNNYMNTSDLTAGLYVFKVQTKQGVTFIKISKE